MSKAKNNTFKVAVLGGESTGKTAFCVRFMTKRFIGDYHPGSKEQTYNHRTQMDQIDVTVEILDARLNEESLSRQVGWADGILFLYSVTDQSSYDLIDRCLTLLPTLRLSSDGAIHRDRIPIVIVANKTDVLPTNRTVAETQGLDLKLRHGYPLFELSVIEMPDSVQDATKELLRRVKREIARSENKKSALNTVRRAFKQKVQRSKSDNFML